MDKAVVLHDDCGGQLICWGVAHVPGSVAEVLGEPPEEQGRAEEVVGVGRGGRHAGVVVRGCDEHEWLQRNSRNVGRQAGRTKIHALSNCTCVSGPWECRKVGPRA